jgi:hypothetical protein
MRVLKATERQEQVTLIARAQYHPILRDYLFAIPNGGSRHPIEARNLKREGVKAGVSDLFLAYPSGMYNGFFLEMKRKGGRLSANQKEWLQLVTNAGYAAGVAYSAAEAWKLLTNYLLTQEK